MNLEFDSEKDLIENLNRGNLQAFQIVVEQFYDILYVYALGLVNERAVAEDIVQEVFLRLWSKKGKLFIETSLKSFLYRSIHNEFVDYYRKKKKEIDFLDRISLETVHTFIQLEDQDLVKKLEKVNIAIELLPKKCREVFLLSKRDGLTNQEISQYLNVSKKTVEGHISKAFKVIRKGLKKTNLLLLFIRPF
ncbi:RNA polymerase sigma-70 factor [Croceitalea sp. MTPC9]|uniref:RNA polymerase sigma factor n=2 Tax=Flavobacteriaceae TaxID=49546 RepID=A0ABW5MSY2_9FLAO|nr:RNA polymerase sigma-70 factor [Croceitalea sp. MTPC6]GMN17262.1 RNA polymerase sigma-70 factor [Croceitalea sp. MTPC9]